MPTERKFIAILAGHTSNWDFPIGLSVALQYRVRIFWLGKWKTGFFRIAESADVPVVLAYLDYARKVGGVGPTIHLSGDQKADLTLIKAFYDTVTSRHPGNS